MHAVHAPLTCALKKGVSGIAQYVCVCCIHSTQMQYSSFLSLFTFSMLGLVEATNIFQMYMFWELVGLSSYLLIAHYYQKPSETLFSSQGNKIFFYFIAFYIILIFFLKRKGV